MSGKIILNVQCLRLLAASMVLFGHIEHEILNRPAFANIGFSPIDPIFWPGGVDIFFVISGFIIFHLGVESFGQPRAVRDFLIRRIIRVAPPYWIFTWAMTLSIVLLPGELAHTQLSVGHLIGSLLFLPTLNPYGNYYPILILGWTLNFEMMFYFLFAVGLRFPRPVGLTIIISLLLILGIAGTVAQPLIGPFAFWGNSIVLEFILGIGLAYARHNGFRFDPRLGWAIFAVGIVCAIVLQELGIAGHYWIWRPLWMGLPAFLICAGPCLIEEKPGAGRLKRLLARGGDCSFALYLSHPFSIGLTAILFKAIHLTGPWLFVWGAIVIAVIVAVIVHDRVERPLTRALLGMLRPRRLSPAVSG